MQETYAYNGKISVAHVSPETAMRWLSWQRLTGLMTVVAVAMLAYGWLGGTALGYLGAVWIVVVAVPMVALARGIELQRRERLACDPVEVALERNNPDWQPREVSQAHHRLLSQTHSKAARRLVEHWEHGHSAQILMQLRDGTRFRILRSGRVVPESRSYETASKGCR